MMLRKNRPEFTISYRVVDEETGKTLEVIKLTGYSKQNLLWRAKRMVDKRYRKRGVGVLPFKVVEESD